MLCAVLWGQSASTRMRTHRVCDMHAEQDRRPERARALSQDLKHGAVQEGHGCAGKAEQRENMKMENGKGVLEKPRNQEAVGNSL